MCSFVPNNRTYRAQWGAVSAAAPGPAILEPQLVGVENFYVFCIYETCKIRLSHGNFFGNTRIIMTNSPELNPLYVWGVMLERYKTFQPKPNTIDELKKVLQTIWDDLPQNSINKAVLSFMKRL